MRCGVTLRRVADESVEVTNPPEKAAYTQALGLAVDTPVVPMEPVKSTAHSPDRHPGTAPVTYTPAAGATGLMSAGTDQLFRSLQAQTVCVMHERCV